LTYREGLRKARAALSSLFSGLKGKKGEEYLRSLSEVLIDSDIGVRTAQKLLQGLQRIEGEDAQRFLKENLIALMTPLEKKIVIPDSPSPYTLLVLGINGVGKTTTIGKMAHHFRDQGKKVLLAAGDTFRAAAIEQLVLWAQASGAEIVKGTQGADASAVIYDAIKAALSRGSDVVIVDTAGRQHTKVDLMEELRKVKRAMGKALQGAPHESLLVLDAGTGQNALSQAREFHSALSLTGLIMAKLDGTAKGGTLVAIARELSLPVAFLGLGEGIDDLVEFRARDYVEALFT